MKVLAISAAVIVIVIGLFAFNQSIQSNQKLNSDKKFIEVTVSNYIIVHGFDATNKEIEQNVTGQEPKKKIIAIERILSISEKYILTSYGFNRLIYWEYEGGYDNLKKQLPL